MEERHLPGPVPDVPNGPRGCFHADDLDVRYIEDLGGERVLPETVEHAVVPALLHLVRVGFDKGAVLVQRCPVICNHKVPFEECRHEERDSYRHCPDGSSDDQEEDDILLFTFERHFFRT